MKLKQTAVAIMLASTGVSLNAIAQDNLSGSTQDKTIEEITVVGTALYRDRTDSIAPQLEYDADFFQRFEPTSVGEMLKRTPGVVFTSDIGEFDAPQLRGLGSGYTQILINGKEVPSSSDDRAFFVDRIPAEVVDKIQIIRSPSADLSGASVGGAINIILKEGASLNGGSVRAGLTNIDGNDTRFNASFAYGGQSNATEWSITGSFQERFVPKEKTEEVFDDEFELNEFEFENDVRDSDDFTLGGNINFNLGENSKLGISANYIETQREEDQDETIFEVEDGEFSLDEVTLDDVDIEEITTIIGLNFEHRFTEQAKLNLFADVSEVEFEEVAIVFEGDDVDSLELDETELIDVENELLRVGAEFEYELNDSVKFTVGIQNDEKDRINSLVVIDDEGEAEGQRFDTDESLLAAYAKAEFFIGSQTAVEAGLRVTSSDRSIVNADDPSVRFDFSETHVLPSLHLSHPVSENGKLRFSLAQTVRRPGFDQLNPIVFEDEPEDDDITVGNPDLDDEVSIGVDIGYEHQVFSRGIIGVNFFYRDVSDVIETGIVGESVTGGSIFSTQNTGDGEVWGVEIDTSFPLSDRTGFFANATFLDSQIQDPFSLRDRRFQDQPDYIFNIGLDHTITKWDMSMGFSLQAQGDSFSEEFGEEVVLEADPNLEVFVEKRFKNGLIVRLTGDNLLDAEKTENIIVFDGLEDQQARVIDEFGREIEKVGPSLSLTVRSSF